MTGYLPIFLDVGGASCLVVGGGSVATEKALTLLRYGARVTVVAPQFTAQLEVRAAETDFLDLVYRTYRERDLDGRLLVIAATDDRALNGRIHDACRARGILINAVDDTRHCSFITGAVASSGPVQVAVSTSGTAPALASRLRRTIQDTVLPNHTGSLALFLSGWRAEVRDRLGSFDARRAFWHEVLDSQVPALLARKAWAEAEAAMAERLELCARGAAHATNHSPSPEDPASPLPFTRGRA